MLKIRRGKTESIIVNVPIDAIDFKDNTFQFRLEITAEELSVLKKSIRVHGLLNPVKLRKKDNRYQIISGGSRLQALKELGIKKALAEVYSNISDKQAMLIASSENLHRSDLSDLEISNQLHALRREYRVPTKNLIEWIGGKEQRYYDLMKLQSMNDRLRQAVHQGELPLYGAVELIKYPERVKSYYQERAIEEGWSVKRIKDERKRVHPFRGIYSQKCVENSRSLYHALKYVRFPETEGLTIRAWELIGKNKGVPGPHKCETTLTIRAQDNEPPYVCENDIDWVVVARGRVDPYGRDVENPSDNVQEWPAWAFLCDECTKLVFPSVNYHEDVHFVIPLKNAETRVRVIPQLSLTL